MFSLRPQRDFRVFRVLQHLQRLSTQPPARVAASDSIRITCARGLAADHGSGWRRGLRRARRAVGGFASKLASALGHASAMRCIAANRHGNPLRGRLKATENGLKGVARFLAQAIAGHIREFPCPREAGFPCP